MQSFELFTQDILYKIAKGRTVKYSPSLKAFTIRVNSWFTRTIYLNDLWDAWRGNSC